MKRIHWIASAVLGLALIACGAQTAGAPWSPQDSAAAADVAPAADAPEAPADLAAAEEVASPDVVEVASTLPPITGGYLHSPLPLPTFTHVVDSTGAAVTPDMLVGHWTVMWFYPAASTAG